MELVKRLVESSVIVEVEKRLIEVQSVPIQFYNDINFSGGTVSYN